MDYSVLKLPNQIRPIKDGERQGGILQIKEFSMMDQGRQRHHYNVTMQLGALTPMMIMFSCKHFLNENVIHHDLLFYKWDTITDCYQSVAKHNLLPFSPSINLHIMFIMRHTSVSMSLSLSSN